MSRPLRVLFLTAYFPKPDNPLIGTWAMAQAKALARRDDLEVRVVSPTAYFPRAAGRLKKGVRAYSHCPPTYEWDGLRVEYPRWLLYPSGHTFLGPHYRTPEPFLRLGWISVRRELERIAREFKPDVVFAHHTGANGYLAMHLKRRTGVPYVITDHMFYEITDCETMPARRQTFSRIMKRSSRMVAVAARMERDTKRIFPFAKTQTVYNGADGPADALWKAPRPPELEDKILVFSAGMFAISKGFPQLVEAWARVAPDFPNARLRIAGDGALRPEIELAIAKSGARDSIELLGVVPHERVEQEMIWADAFALISRDEPFGVVFAEAMAARTPLIWPEDSGIGELLIDQTHGYRVPPFDVEATARALQKLLSDATARAQMGQTNRALWQEQLTWDANAAAMSAIFHQVAGERGAVGEKQTDI